MIYAADVETNGLRHAHGHKAFLIGYSDALGEPQVIEVGTDSTTQLLTQMLNKDNECVGHNLAFDLPFMADHNLVPVGRLHDTMIAAHVFFNLEESKSLKVLAKKYCGMENTDEQKLDEWFLINGVSKDKRDYSKVPLALMIPYLKSDIRMTLALFNFYRKEGVIDSDAYKAEMAVLPVVTRIVARGMRIDPVYAKQEFDKAVALIADLEQRALRDYGIDNLGSNAQIADALFTRGGLKCVTFTEKKNICLDSSALSQYVHPLVEIVQKHRDVTKLCGTYLEAVLQKSHQGRLYCSLNQVGARTGRFSSSEPNLQNIPRNDVSSPINLRKAFICESDSKMLLIDLSQIELRILAHYAKEPAMIETLTDRAGDLHARTAIEMFGEVNKELRTVAKTLNFAIVYGAGGAALVEQLTKALPNKKISLSQAKDFKQKYLKGYPAVQSFLWAVQNTINSRGYVVGKSGRRYFCEKDKAYRASNYLIQGESAMIMKNMMCKVDALLKGKKTHMVNIIHDEFLMRLHKDEEYLIQELLAVIEDLTTWRVPLYANAEISETNWAEKHKI